MARGTAPPLDPEKLREARADAGLSQAALARALGIQRQRIIAYEQGKERPEITRLAALAEALDVYVGDLVADGALPSGLAGLRTGAGLTLAAGAAALGLALPQGAGIAANRASLSGAERGRMPLSWQGQQACDQVREAMADAYQAADEAVHSAWEETFGPTPAVAETAPPAPAQTPSEDAFPYPAWMRELPVCPYSPAELNAARVKNHGDGLYQVRVDHTPQGWVRRDGPGRWSYASLEADTERPRTWMPVLAPSPTRTLAVQALLATPGPLWSAPMPGIDDPVEDDQRTPAAQDPVRVTVSDSFTTDESAADHHFVLTGDHDHHGQIRPRTHWDHATGWGLWTNEDPQVPVTLSAHAGLAEAVPELLAPLEEGPVRITWNRRHRRLGVEGLRTWSLHAGLVPGREDIVVHGKCRGWLQKAPGGAGFTAHTTDGPLPEGPWGRREEAALALFAHLWWPMPLPDLDPEAHRTRRPRRKRPYGERGLCPYTDAELARPELAPAPGERSGYQVHVAGDLVGWVRRTNYGRKQDRWQAAAAPDGNGQRSAPTRAAALEALLARPGPLWADPELTIVH